MTGPSPNSYGSSAGVAAFVPVRAGTGSDFTPTTRPTLAQVEKWIDSVSAMLNSMLAAAGFTTPVTQASVVEALAMFVEEEVAAICEGVNGSGRFGPTAKAVGKAGRFSLILSDVAAFIEANQVGFERLGAPRPKALGSGILFRDTDDAGDPTYPLFTRESFAGGMTFTETD